MAVIQALTKQCAQDWLNGVHQPGDVYKGALYLQASASLDSDTTAYTTTGEIIGAGYVAGGATLAGFTVGFAGGKAYLSFTDPSWPASTITADAALIYNATRSNKAMAVLAFGITVSTNGTWTLDLPAAGATAIMRIVVP